MLIEVLKSEPKGIRGTNVFIMEALSRKGSIETVAKYSQECIAKDPLDLSAKYICAISCMYLGDFDKGIEVFNQLSDQAGKLRSEMQFDYETLHFLGWACVQLAMVYELLASKTFRDRRTCVENSYKALSTAFDIAREIHEQELEYKAGSMLANYHTWSRDGKQGKWLIPESPYCLQIEPTNRCNIKCSMCPHPQMTRKKGDLHPDLVDKIMSSWSNRVYEINTSHLLFHYFPLRFSQSRGVKLYFMGETLLHQELNTLVERISSYGAQCSIQTNGVLLSRPEVREKLLNSKAVGIYISIDGISSQTYESVRRGANWENLVSGIRELDRERKQKGMSKTIQIGISSILPDSSRAGMEKVATFLSALKEYTDCVSFLFLDKRCKGQFYDLSENVYGFENEYSAYCQDDVPVCTECTEKLNILWDGTVVPCCYDFNGEIVLGKADDGIDNVWARQAKELQLALLGAQVNNPVCRKCLNSEAQRI